MRDTKHLEKFAKNREERFKEKQLFINKIKQHSSDNSKDVKKVIKSIAKNSTIPKTFLK